MNVSIVDDPILENTEGFFARLTSVDSAVTLDPERSQVNVFISEDPNDGKN